MYACYFLPIKFPHTKHLHRPRENFLSSSLIEKKSSRTVSIGFFEFCKKNSSSLAILINLLECTLLSYLCIFHPA